MYITCHCHLSSYQTKCRDGPPEQSLTRNPFLKVCASFCQCLTGILFRRSQRRFVCQNIRLIVSCPAGHWPPAMPLGVGVGHLPLPRPPRPFLAGGGSHACDRCGRTYSSRDSLRHHLETHEGKTLCPYCGKRFATISSRNHHVRSVHAEPPPSVYDVRH